MPLLMKLCLHDSGRDTSPRTLSFISAPGLEILGNQGFHSTQCCSEKNWDSLGRKGRVDIGWMSSSVGCRLFANLSWEIREDRAEGQKVNRAS